MNLDHTPRPGYVNHGDPILPDPDEALLEAIRNAVLDNFSDTANGYRLNASAAARDALVIFRAAESRRPALHLWALAQGATA